MATLAFSQFKGAEKKRDIDSILDKLEKAKDAKESLSGYVRRLISAVATDRDDLLARLRGHTTSLDGLDPLLTKRGISLCCQYGFDCAEPSQGRMALRCICNALLQVERTRQIFVDAGYGAKAVERMGTGDSDDELLAGRILLLCTYGTDLDFKPLAEEHKLATAINGNIARHAESPAARSPSAEMAYNETLKLLYNVTAHYSSLVPLFAGALAPLLALLHQDPLPSPPLQPPLTSLINALGQLDLARPDVLFPAADETTHLDRLVHILDLATQSHPDSAIDTLGASLLQLLLRLAELAPPEPKKRMAALLLPTAADRERVLGQGDSLSARLLRLAASARADHARRLVPGLLFELSGRDPARFAHNVGYGHAAGFLQANGLSLPAGSLGEGESGVLGEVEDDEETGAGAEGVEVNPITGQRRDREPQPDVPEMTDEEKEREAERLFVLFERLRATGVVDVENPVTQAMREGRFEEVD